MTFTTNEPHRTGIYLIMCDVAETWIKFPEISEDCKKIESFSNHFDYLLIFLESAFVTLIYGFHQSQIFVLVPSSTDYQHSCIIILFIKLFQQEMNAGNCFDSECGRLWSEKVVKNYKADKNALRH